MPGNLPLRRSSGLASARAAHSKSSARNTSTWPNSPLGRIAEERVTSGVDSAGEVAAHFLAAGMKAQSLAWWARAQGGQAV
jgi:hypothetical protein